MSTFLARAYKAHWIVNEARRRRASILLTIGHESWSRNDRDKWSETYWFRHLDAEPVCSPIGGGDTYYGYKPKVTTHEFRKLYPPTGEITLVKLTRDSGEYETHCGSWKLPTGGKFRLPEGARNIMIAHLQRRLKENA